MVKEENLSFLYLVVYFSMQYEKSPSETSSIIANTVVPAKIILKEYYSFVSDGVLPRLESLPKEEKKIYFDIAKKNGVNERPVSEIIKYCSAIYFLDKLKDMT